MNILFTPTRGCTTTIGQAFVAVKFQTKENFMFMKSKILLCATLCFIVSSVSIAPSQENDSPFARARKWLQAQMVDNGDGSLIASYSNGEVSRSFIYDQALAITAFTMLTDYDRAARLIKGLVPLIEKDGSLQFSYDAKNPVHEKEAMVRTGAIAWVGYSVCFYLKVSGDKKNSSEFIDFAKKIAAYVISRQIKENNDMRQWLVTGGDASIRLTAEKEIKEVFVPGPVTWCSVEHNIDSYFFLKLLGELTGDRSYDSAAFDIKRGLIAKCWDRKHGQFIRGVNQEEGRDRVLALDCASWGGIFAASVQDIGKMESCIDSVRSRYMNEADGITGCKAYYNKPVYENYLVGKLIYPDDPRKSWKSLKAVWPEGTLGVAALFLKAGKQVDAEALLRSLEKMQDASGGIPYHSIRIPNEFETNPSVASTAWYIMVSMMAKDARLLKAFWE